MQLIKKLFGQSQAAAGESAQFHESQTSTEIGSRNASRRELVQVVLRDSMRRHGIPSAWIECRILSVVSRKSKNGMHVQFIVRDGTDRLLAYVPAFQRSFMKELGRFEPRVEDWLFSVSWQFLNVTADTPGVMPDPQAWTVTAPAPISGPAPAVPAPPALTAQPQSAPATDALTTPQQPAAALELDDYSDVLEDLQALYAIRDAAMRHDRPAARGPAGEQDFENTRPASDLDPPPAKLPHPRRW